MSNHKLVYDGRTIEYEVIRKDVKNVNLRVKPDLKVVVSASERVPQQFIDDLIYDKAPWILKRINEFKETLTEVTERKYISGESYKYLGKQYRLKVIEDNYNKVMFKSGYLMLHVKDTSNHNKKEHLVKTWFREKAIEKVAESLERVYPLVEKYDIIKPTWEVRLMKARWGSCQKEKEHIILNSELIKAPKYCIDYVVLHELIHLKYKNHDRQFYSFLTSLMPDWKFRKEILDEEIVREL